MHGALFLGHLAENGHGAGHAAATLYLLGLLHNIDALLGLPMAAAVEGMPLGPALKAALMRDEGEPFSGYARVIDSVWRNDWPSAQRDFRALEIPMNTAACLFMRAGEQTTSLMSALGHA
jgi:c-di-GMP-related signal transduction protein